MATATASFRTFDLARSGRKQKNASMCALGDVTAQLISGLALMLAVACGPSAWPGGVIARFGWSKQGVRVAEVPPDGPAAKAGLKEDDQIIAIDGEPVSGMSSQQVQQRLSGEVGSVVVLTVNRAGSTVELRVERAPYRN
jgi:C-terminal processing protease CtpA/Prc